MKTITEFLTFLLLRPLHFLARLFGIQHWLGGRLGGLRQRPRSTIIALRDIGDIDAIRELLKHSDPKARCAGLDASSRLAPEKVAEIVASKISDECSRVRSKALHMLNSLTSARDATQAQAALPALLQLLRHPALEGDYRNNPDADWKRAKHTAAAIVGRFGPAAKDAVPSLLEMLDDSYSSEREVAIRALGSIGPAAKQAVPKLTQLLETAGFDECATLIRALGGIGPDAQDAVLVILKVVTVNKVVTFNETDAAVVAFGRIGPGGEAAIPFLMDQLRQASPKSSLPNSPAVNKWQATIAHSLAKIGKASIPALMGAIADKDAGLANCAQSALAGLGEVALPAVLAAIKSADPLMRDRALSTLEIISQQNPAVIAAHLDEVAPLLVDSSHAAPPRPTFKDAQSVRKS